MRSGERQQRVKRRSRALMKQRAGSYYDMLFLSMAFA
jgi:hypothetical protein